MATNHIEKPMLDRESHPNESPPPPAPVPATVGFAQQAPLQQQMLPEFRAPQPGPCVIRWCGCSQKNCGIASCCCALCCPCSCCCRCPAAPVKEAQFTAAGTKFVSLPDGRKLEYLIGGDPHGVPALCFSSQFGSCFGVSGVMFEKAEEFGLKIISVTTPGFGLSDGYPLGMDRSIHDFPGDVRFVIEAEKISSFHIFSVSAGAEYAAMVAKTFPESMIRNVCISCPPVARDAPRLDAAKESPMIVVMKGLSSAPFAGDCLAYVMGRCMKPRALFEAAPDPKAAMKFLEEEGPPRGDKVLATMLKDVEHGFSHTYRGAMDNLYPIIYEPHHAWVPSLSTLVRKGHAFGITSAADDGANPQGMQKWWHKNIEGSTWIEFPATGWGHCHMGMPGGTDRIFEFLKSGKDPGIKQE